MRALAAGAALLSAAVFARAHDGFTAPSSGVALSPGAIVELRWSSVCGSVERRDLDETEIVLSLDGGTTFPIRVSPELKPCASRYLWKVPSLPTTHARVALRGGFEGRNPTETVAIVSAEFRILAEPDGRVEALRRHAAEWSTTPQPASLTADDLLEHRLSSPCAMTGPAPDRPEGALTGTSSSSTDHRVEVRRAVPESPGPLFAFLAFASSVRSASAPTPLRL